MDLNDQDARALSVRQPWAWAIVSGYKDVENRSQGFADVIAPRALGKTIFIHASKHFVKSEFDESAKTIARLGIKCPEPDALSFGGVVGTPSSAVVTHSEFRAPICRPNRPAIRNPRSGRKTINS